MRPAYPFTFHEYASLKHAIDNDEVSINVKTCMRRVTHAFHIGRRYRHPGRPHFVL